MVIVVVLYVHNKVLFNPLRPGIMKFWYDFKMTNVSHVEYINSMNPGGFNSNFKYVILEQILITDSLINYRENALIRMIGHQ